MRIFPTIASIAAAGLLATGAAAQTTAGGGASVSTPNGSAAGGVTAGTADRATQDKPQKRRDGRRMQREERTAPTTANSASTYGSGTIYTDRNRATGGVTAGGTASGTGSQASSTAIDAYGSTTREGSTGEVYGDSTATSTNPPPRTPR